MKKLTNIIAVITLIAIQTICAAQSAKKEPEHSGVYLTLADFKSGKLTYGIDCRADKHKIILHDFLSKPYIDVIHEGMKHTLQKKDIYAFRDCNDIVFRFFNNREYQLTESGAINIYFLEESRSEGKGFRIVKIYYFSILPDGEIKPLTTANLKAAFPDNHKFHDALDTNLRDSDPSEYDTFHKMFKVNHIYHMSLDK